MKILPGRGHILFMTAFICMQCMLHAYSQGRAVLVSFRPMWGNAPFILADSAFNTQDDMHTTIDVLKFYIGHIHLLRDGRIVGEATDPFHLVDASRPTSLDIIVNRKDDLLFDGLAFDLGVDSVTSVSGVMGGDLDPTRGMYWSWNSGYIDCKLEGKSRACGSMNHEFQFHIGGYRHPHESIQQLRFDLKTEKHINISLDMQQVLLHTDLEKMHHVMSPGAHAVMLSKKMAEAFAVSVP